MLIEFEFDIVELLIYQLKLKFETKVVDLNLVQIIIFNCLFKKKITCKLS